MMCEQKFDLEQVRPGKKVLYLIEQEKMDQVSSELPELLEYAGIAADRVVRDDLHASTGTEILNRISLLHAGDCFVLDDLQSVKKESPFPAAEFQLSFARSLFRLASSNGVNCVIVASSRLDYLELLKSEADLVVDDDWKGKGTQNEG